MANIITNSILYYKKIQKLDISFFDIYELTARKDTISTKLFGKKIKKKPLLVSSWIE
jgi:hypothetical protein